ncbi:hypothetical protein H6G36_29185 [Anabaena minutissima FACHB-250]|nr:hypothetical protein [Anabaena minutissima FACHB-250]
MEIILRQFNIEDVINSHWQSAQSKTTSIQRDREEAEKTAVNALIQQFKKELDTYLEQSVQSALNINVIPPQNIAVFSVFGIFRYLDVEFILVRNAQQWEISFNGKTVASSPELLQKTILLELGKMKYEKLS